MSLRDYAEGVASGTLPEAAATYNPSNPEVIDLLSR